MALRPPLRGAKPKPSLPPHYYEGFLEKKGPQDKGYKKYWTGLQGLTLYFYNTNRDVQYVEKIDLDNFVSLTDSYLRSGPQASNEGVGLSLKLRGQEVKLKAESLEAREMWKGFIFTMVEMQVPSNLTLLPGHIYMMSEALSKEQERRAQLSQRRSTSSLHYELMMEEEMPACYFKVSRTEARVLLERNLDCGNMLLRPGGDGKSISVTTCQMLNGTPVVKHYKVSRAGQQYVVEVDRPHRCSSLADVVEYFVSNTKKTLVPLSLDEDYAEKLAGAKVEAMIPPTSRQSPLSKPLPTPPASEEDQEETYVNDEDVAAIKGTKPKPACPTVGPVKVIWERGGQTKAPPVPPSKPAAKGQYMRTPSSALNLRQHGSSQASRQATSWVGDLPTDISEELARKLQERRANLEN
ncbi:signal-transducing adaptor protein 2 isoform X2 [Caretta caretta]|uniref:signal-transducing adaptor protein 2 isoform X2 n=1 Tax=Caretta caretta TaxID=8467 RepID=UPI003F4BE7CB